jgi:hypothetical protein
MEQVRQNWLRFLQDPGGRAEFHIPRTLTITRWEDIPEAARRSIEEGAARTSYIEGLYQQTAYIVEEIYTRIEEISFLRVQQHFEASGGRTPSRSAVSEISRLIYLLRNILHSSVESGNNVVTPALLEQTDAAMLAYLRRRYPNRRDPGLDSYEVVFYLSSIHGGLPPIYDHQGNLISAPPPGVRVR